MLWDLRRCAKIINMILLIDTTRSGKVIVALKDGDKAIKTLKAKNEFGSQALLPLIDKTLKSQGKNFKDLKGIEVSTGPGSYTGIKVGVAVANALAFTLKIPVNNKKLETDILYQ